MATEHILKVPRSEDEGSFVMLNIKSNGSKPLDIALLATDGDSAWASAIKHSKISKLRSKKSPVDEAEWENTLSSTLLPQSGDEQRPKSKSVEKLELTALVAAGQLSFVIRRNISGITQRLGEITLKALDDEEAGDRVELLDWLAIAVDRTASLEKKVEDLGSKYEEQGNTIQKLNQQLDELIEAKKEHEALLLEKFQALLNAKKLKIRDQQRLLASAKVDPQTATQVQASRQSESRRVPDSSRRSKRKANGLSPTKPKSESDNDMDFEKLPLEEPENQNETPAHSDADATEDESEDEKMASAPPPTESAKGRLLESRGQQGSQSRQSEPLSLPPRRELPFARDDKPGKISADSAPSASVEPAHNDDSVGSETSDDEL